MVTEPPTCTELGSPALLPAVLQPIADLHLPEKEITCSRLKLLAAVEWSIASLTLLVTSLLLIIRGTHGGALWRDECAAVQLAQMPSLSEIAHNFQHEAFPLLFPVTVRAYIALFGASDLSMRCFGIAVGVALLAVLWLAARIIHRGPPLISTALLGLNATFLVWGTSVRGYGLGCVLSILALAAFVRLLERPSPAQVALTALASLAAVQCLIYNLVLVIAFALSACAVALARRQPRQIIANLGVLGLCLVSFVPYIGPYSSGSTWSVIVEFPVTTRLLWNQFNGALGNPHPATAILWHFAAATLIAAAAWRVFIRRPEPKPDQGLLLFFLFVFGSSLFGYYEFLQLLSYLPRSWYYLALIALIAVTLDSFAGTLSSNPQLRVWRIILAALALAVLPFNVWGKVNQRQTNIDEIANVLTHSAQPSDLIVIAPWQYGISFGRYYHGGTPWTTLPAIGDLRLHRYDLFQEKMLSPHAIDDVLSKVQETLASGNRVWMVGGVKFPPRDQPPRMLPAPPNASVGWDNVAYSESWLERLSVFVRSHSTRGQTISVSTAIPVSQFEDVPLVAVEGWQ